jgi:hypothetical protein
MKMRNLLKNRLALSTVVTTLIILVVSVLLAGVVTYFAINVTSTRVQEESLHLTKQHVWYQSSGSFAEAAILVINTGGRDVVLDKITVRGQECAWSNVFFAITSNPPTADLSFIANASVDKGLTLMTSYTFANSTDTDTDIVLTSGNSIIIYIKSPDSISVNDVGLTVAITVYTSQAMYYKETNVETAV